MAHHKLDNKRMQKLLGLTVQTTDSHTLSNPFGNLYFATQPLPLNIKRCCSTQTNPSEFATQSSSSLIRSPSPVKKLKTTDSTQHGYNSDDLYCYESEPVSSEMIPEQQYKIRPLLQQKHCYKIDPDYIQEYNSKEYNYKIRAIIIQRMFENCAELHLKSCFNAIELFDRFLFNYQKKALPSQQQLRLLSLTVIYISAKVYEVPPDIQKLLIQSSLPLTKSMVLSYEKVILQVLEWHTNALTIQNYLEDILLRFQQFFYNKPIGSVILQSGQLHKINHLIVINSEDHLILEETLKLIVLDHRHLQYDYSYIAFALIYCKYEEIIEDSDYQYFLSDYNLSFKFLESEIRYVNKFYRVITTYVQDNNFGNISSLELLKKISE